MTQFNVINKSGQRLKMMVGHNVVHMQVTDKEGNTITVALDENQLCHIQEILRSTIDEY